MPIQHLLSPRYALSFEQRQRIERVASSFPEATRRVLFRQRIAQLVRSPTSRGVVTDGALAIAIACATRELQAAR